MCLCVCLWLCLCLYVSVCVRYRHRKGMCGRVFISDCLWAVFQTMKIVMKNTPAKPNFK